MEQEGSHWTSICSPSFHKVWQRHRLPGEEDIRGVGHEFNINSPQQLSQVLYEQLNLPRRKRTQSGYSTEAAVLENMRGLHPVIEFLLKYRQLTKLKSTYIDALPALV